VEGNSQINNKKPSELYGIELNALGIMAVN
jgi:hypothetical protein